MKRRTSSRIAFVLLVALGVCAPAASAEPLSMTFTEGRANVGVQLSDAALWAAPKAAPFAGQIDPGSGSITSGVLGVPQFATHITEPIDADVTVDFKIGTISGSFTQATGALSLAGEAGGTLTSEGEECTVSTDPQILTLTTAGSSGGVSPRLGAPFAAGLTGPGAIAGQWTDMHAEPVSPKDPEDVNFCENVESRIDGPGGIWLRQQGVPTKPPPPPPTACIVPRLGGKTLARAKVALRAANCKLGKVHKPKWRKGHKRRPLVVKSSSPRPGAEPADGTVDLRLGPIPGKPRR